MRTCRICGAKKNDDQFNFRAGKVRRHNHCKACQKEISRKSYLKHRDRVLKRTKAKKKRYSVQSAAMIDKFLAGKICVICGETDRIVFEFHHRDPAKKKYNVGGMAQRGYAQKTILKEMKKCDILCANCHRRLHRSG